MPALGAGEPLGLDMDMLGGTALLLLVTSVVVCEPLSCVAGAALRMIVHELLGPGLQSPDGVMFSMRAPV